MNVCDVKGIDEDGFLDCSMMTKAKNTSVKDESESIMWPAKFSSSLCIGTLAFRHEAWNHQAQERLHLSQ